MKIKISGKEVVKGIGVGLKVAAGIGATKITKDILVRAVSENISDNVFVKIGVVVISAYVGSKASEFIEGTVDEFVDLIDLYVNVKSEVDGIIIKKSVEKAETI